MEESFHVVVACHEPNPAGDVVDGVIRSQTADDGAASSAVDELPTETDPDGGLVQAPKPQSLVRNGTLSTPRPRGNAGFSGRAGGGARSLCDRRLAGGETPLRTPQYE